MLIYLDFQLRPDQINLLLLGLAGPIFALLEEKKNYVRMCSVNPLPNIMELRPSPPWLDTYGKRLLI